MDEDNSLQILIEAALDFAKSLQNLTAQMSQLRDKFKSYQIKITAGLDQSATAAQIRSDLKKINSGKNRVQLTGQVDKATTQKNVNATLKKLKSDYIKISGDLDIGSTETNINRKLKQIPQVKAKVDAEVNGADKVEDLGKKMDSTGVSASSLASRVYLARTALQALRRAAQEARDTVVELDKAATSLAIVTGKGNEEAYRLLSQYNEMAQQLGATTSQISAAATDWLRQGKSAAETAALIEQATVFSKVAMIDASTATKDLTSAMKGYNDVCCKGQT